MSMSTTYVSINEKIRQVASLIFDHLNLKGDEAVFIDGEIFFQNFSWLTESELKDVLNKLGKEESLVYEWVEKGLGYQPYGVYADPNHEELLKHEHDFVGIICKQNVKKLQKYLEKENGQVQVSEKRGKSVKFPYWEGTQTLDYKRAKRELIIDGIPYIVPKNPAPQREVLLDLAVQAYNNNSESWVYLGTWTAILKKEGKECRGEPKRAFREAYENLQAAIRDSLKKTNVLEWSQYTFRIRRKSASVQ